METKYLAALVLFALIILQVFMPALLDIVMSLGIAAAGFVIGQAYGTITGGKK